MESIPELVDGGMCHNNSVEIALEEARRLAESSQQDTEKSWSKVRNQQNDALKQRMYRINADLGETATLGMDNVEQVVPLSTSVREWISNSAPQRQIREITCILVASSFYFEPSGRSFDVDSSIGLPGLIKCRLSDNADAVAGLGRLFSACRSTPLFVVENVPCHAEEQSFALPLAAIKASGSWEDVKVLIKIPGEDASTRLSLEMLGLYEGDSRFSISGFPRFLMRSDFLPGARHRRSL